MLMGLCRRVWWQLMPHALHFPLDLHILWVWLVLRYLKQSLLDFTNFQLLLLDIFFKWKHAVPCSSFLQYIHSIITQAFAYSYRREAATGTGLTGQRFLSWIYFWMLLAFYHAHLIHFSAAFTSTSVKDTRSWNEVGTPMFQVTRELNHYAIHGIFIL